MFVSPYDFDQVRSVCQVWSMLNYWACTFWKTWTLGGSMST